MDQGKKCTELGDRRTNTKRCTLTLICYQTDLFEVLNQLMLKATDLSLREPSRAEPQRLLEWRHDRCSSAELMTPAASVCASFCKWPRLDRVDRCRKRPTCRRCVLFRPLRLAPSDIIVDASRHEVEGKSSYYASCRHANSLQGLCAEHARALHAPAPQDGPAFHKQAHPLAFSASSSCVRGGVGDMG